MTKKAPRTQDNKSPKGKCMLKLEYQVCMRCSRVVGASFLAMQKSWVQSEHLPSSDKLESDGRHMNIEHWTGVELSTNTENPPFNYTKYSFYRQKKQRQETTVCTCVKILFWTPGRKILYSRSGSLKQPKQRYLRKASGIPLKKSKLAGYWH